MRFLIRAAFWLFVVGLWLPAHSGPNAGPDVRAGEALSAASAAVSDMGQFCSRRPSACGVESEALAGFAQKLQAGAERLYDLLRGQLARRDAHPASQGRETLLPMDLRAPWRVSPARKDAGPSRA